MGPSKCLAFGVDSKHNKSLLYQNPCNKFYNTKMHAIKCINTTLQV